MDPKQALRDLLEALVDQDRYVAQACAMNLADWLSHRGFMPDRFDVAEVALDFLRDHPDVLHPRVSERIRDTEVKRPE